MTLVAIELKSSRTYLRPTDSFLKLVRSSRPPGTTTGPTSEFLKPPSSYPTFEDSALCNSCHHIYLSKTVRREPCTTQIQLLSSTFDLLPLTFDLSPTSYELVYYFPTSEFETPSHLLSFSFRLPILSSDF
jgi:hypothetical protein